ncbi:hypothetical protein BH09BAC1_BH09BAC1_14770 [soil metagenome]
MATKAKKPLKKAKAPQKKALEQKKPLGMINNSDEIVIKP